ncbi:MAG: hypothetical protein R6V50_04040 [Thermoplasmatota archaeon]
MQEDVLSVKTVVEEALASDPRARANDKWLSFQTLRRMGFKVYIPFDDMDAMPSFESISRARRKLQSTGKFLAPKEVKEERQDEEKKMEKINRWWH